MAITDILGGLGSPVPNPNATTSQATTATMPQFFSNYLANIAQQGAGAVQSGGVAPLSSLQNEAIGAAPSTAMGYQPFLNTASNALNTAASTAPPDIVNKFMSPYVNDVVNKTQALGEKQIQDIINPQSIALGVGSGNFDTGMSSEAANALGQNETLALQNLSGTEANLLNTGYQSAEGQAQNYLNNQTNVGGTAGNVAGEAGTTGANALTALENAGGIQQTEAQNQLNYPMVATGNEAALLKGYSIPNNTNVNTTGPLQTPYYTNSPVNQFGTYANALAGLNKSNPGLFNSLINSIPGLSSLFNPTTPLPSGGMQTTGEDPTTGLPLSNPIDPSTGLQSSPPGMGLGLNLDPTTGQPMSTDQSGQNYQDPLAGWQQPVDMTTALGTGA